MNPLGLDLHALLRGFGWARVAVAAFLVGVGPWAPAVLLPTASGGGLLFAVLAIVVASSGVLLLGRRPPRPRVIAGLLCLLDAALVTAVVAATGGARSVLVFLYVLLATAACLLLPRWGALAIAVGASGLYAMLILARAIVPALALDEPVDHAAALDVLAVFVTGATLTIVSVVAGGLAERSRLSQADLAIERRSLGDLRAFSDVIFQSAGTGLVALDRAHCITAMNRAAEAITGVRAERAVGACWGEVFGPGFSTVDLDAATSGEPGAPVRREIELSRPDGATVPLRITVSALEAGDGTRLGCIAACEDLSAVRAMEAEVRQADRLATVGRMAANIAHEIRNPLASLSGAVEALTVAAGTEEMRSRLADVVVRESLRLSEILGNFLAYARPARLLPEHVDAATVLDDVLRALAERPPAEGVKVVRAYAPTLPLEADRERLRQVLWTLCVNAVAAMPAGGELRIDGQRRAGIVEIIVTDTGQGIPPQNLAHAFEPFFAIRPGATGLGYALVHRIVHEHRGEVTVRSEGGLGAEFSLRLPERHA